MRFRFALAFAVAAWFACSALADEAATLKTYMEGQMRSYISAFKNKDAKGVEAVLRKVMDKSYIDYGKGDRKMTLDQLIASVKQQITFFKSVKSMSMTMTKVKVTGNTATSTENFAGEFVVPNPQAKGGTSVFKVVNSSTGGYKKFGNVWRAVSSKTISEKITVDGKPMPGGAAG